MVSSSGIITRNTAYLTGALVVQKILSFVFFLIIARLLGREGTGEYIAAFSITSIFGVFVDLGLGPVLIKEIAKEHGKSTRYLGNVVAVKLVLALISFIALFVMIFILDLSNKNHPAVVLLAVAGMVMIFDSFILTATSVFRGWQNLWYESIVVILNKVAILGVGTLIIFSWPSSVNVALTILFGSLLSLVLITYFMKVILDLRWNLSWDKNIQLELWKMAAPFALANIFSAVYAYSDSVMLSVIKGNSAVGLYSVATKTMNAFQFLPSAFMAAVFPAMSSFYHHSSEQLRVLFERSFRYLLMVSMPISVGLFVLADKFVGQVGADYGQSATAVRILVPSLVFVFLSFPIGSLLNASNRQRWQTALIGVSMFLNFSLNLWLIPTHSYIGASWSWFITNMIVFMAGLYLVKSVIKYRLDLMIKSTFKVLISAILMGWLVYGTIAVVPVIISVGGGFFAYLGLLFITGEINYADIKYLYNLFSKSELSVKPSLAGE